MKSFGLLWLSNGGVGMLNEKAANLGLLSTSQTRLWTPETESDDERDAGLRAADFSIDSFKLYKTVIPPNFPQKIAAIDAPQGQKWKRDEFEEG